MFEREPVLDQQLAARSVVGNQGAIGLRIAVRRDWQLVQLGSYAGSDSALHAAVLAALGVALPASTSAVLVQGRHKAYRIAADQYWIISDDATVPAKLRAAIAPAMGSVTTLSSARARIAIQGDAAVALLGKLVSIDLRPQSFAVGSFAQTGLHHVGALLERLGPDSFELYVLRTYAASTWEWLIDAALPFGYEVIRE